jgi:hypothetical protein
MVLELICLSPIEINKKMNIPRSANIYELNFSINQIAFYYELGCSEIRLNFWKLQKNAREMKFEKRENKYGHYIIVPRFYDWNGKLLKIGNR